MRKVPPILCLILVAVFAAARPAAAQDEDTPPTLRISMFQCHWDKVGDAMDQFEEITLPVWNELVDEGMIIDAGTFIHAWADEWNVGIYTVATSIQAVLDFTAEAGRRIEERHPDAPNTFGEACPRHRDGFYVLGPSTGMDDDDGDVEEGDEGEGS
ncbi:MAG: hypothetical protein KAJ67_07965 [Gemmatimonadetes bacterium]|nr:hypothetical protein [Gemmatimonadota bacterium]